MPLKLAYVHPRRLASEGGVFSQAVDGHRKWGEVGLVDPPLLLGLGQCEGCHGGRELSTHRLLMNTTLVNIHIVISHIAVGLVI